jgi:hypothetical protein
MELSKFGPDALPGSCPVLCPFEKYQELTCAGIECAAALFDLDGAGVSRNSFSAEPFPAVKELSVLID